LVGVIDVGWVVSLYGDLFYLLHARDDQRASGVLVIEVEGEVLFSAVCSRGWRGGVICGIIDFFPEGVFPFPGWAVVGVERAVDEGVYIRSVEV
jgi:hypothetical protein